MAIDLVNPGDGWMNRQGAFIGEINRVAALYGSGATNTAFQSIWTLFATSDQAAVTTLPDAVSTFQQSGATYTSTLINEGQSASILQVNRANPLVPPGSFPVSVQRVADQMVATAQSIQRPTLTSTATAGASNLGNTQFWLSTTNIYGDPLDMVQNETFTALCTSQGSGFSATFSVTGQPTVSVNSWNWPQGTGGSASVTVVDPAVNGLISNGGFSLFTVPNTPDSWTLINGSAGTTVFKSAGGGVRTSTDAVYLQSDGSSATQIAQAVSLTANTVYAVTFQAKLNSASVSGTFIVELFDPDGGAVLTNDAGTALSYTRNLNGQITTSYQQFTVFFSTPRQLPTTVQLRIGYSVAGVSTRQLFLDLIQVFQPVALYGASGTGTRGPWVAAVADTDVSAVDDTYSLVFTNSLTTQSFVLGLQRAYGLRELGIYLPSALSPTISEALVLH